MTDHNVPLKPTATGYRLPLPADFRYDVHRTGNVVLKADAPTVTRHQCALEVGGQSGDLERAACGHWWLHTRLGYPARVRWWRFRSLRRIRRFEES